MNVCLSAWIIEAFSFSDLQPWESYKPDISIDVKKHHKPETTMDKFAYWTVQVLKYPTYLFFQVAILYNLFLCRSL